MYQILRIACLAVPIILIAICAYDLLDDDEPCYVAYHSGEETEFVDDSIVRDCMFELDGFSFRCWNTEEDGSGQSYVPGDHLGKGGSVIELYAQWDPVEAVPTVGTGQASPCPAGDVGFLR